MLIALLLACTDGGLTKVAPADTGGDSADSDGGDSADSDSAVDSGDSDSGGDSGDSGDTGLGDPLILSYPDQRVGIFYLTWHAFAADAMARLDPSAQRTVEDVIRAAPGLDFSDIVWDAGLYGEAAAFHYHQEPQLGFYCLYRPRDGEPPLAEPNFVDACPDIPTVARTHAQQLWNVGVDFVYVDVTNLPAVSDFSDVLGLRPLEVLIEEWGILRRSGIPTPQIAAWVPAVAYTDGTEPMIRRVLDAYDDAVDDLILTDDAGRPVVFVVNHAGLPPDEGLLNEVRARGALPVKLWGNLGRADLDAGTAGWMQPCTVGDQFTTLVTRDTPCDQWYTRSSPLGTVLSVSRSYQVGYASLPLQASGRAGGLTLQKQFETAFAVRPDWLLINAWNEHIAQPQANPYDPALGGLRRSMGVTAVSDADPTADWLWVDMYGADLNRDLEPTVEDGGAGLDLLASCLRVWRTGATTCADAGEACCQLAEGWSLVYSVRAGGLDSDHVPTLDPAELSSLVRGGWTEVCNPHYGPPGLCGGGTTGDGPFHLFPSSGADRGPIYRCWSGADHFLSPDVGCEGRTVESLLGFVSTRRTSETPRPLTRCHSDSGGAHMHWLDESCPSGFRTEAILGYVR